MTEWIGMMQYFVFSNEISAWTLQQGIKQLQLDLLCASSVDGLLARSDKTPELGDTLLFTSENSLKQYYSRPGDFHFYPQEMPYALIDDKLKFARFLETIGEMPVPYWDIEHQPEMMPIYIKARHSWHKDMKLPRGHICHNQQEYEKTIITIKEKFDLNWFYHQKLLNSPYTQNLSVSGFFDYRNMVRNLVIITKKLHVQAGPIGTGCIVQTTDDPENLIGRTSRILEELKYTGPFELEFFCEDDCYYVLELNPRFWVQHGLFLRYFGNGVIKRYLNMDTPADWLKDCGSYPTITWFDSIALFSSIFRLSLRTPYVYVKQYINNRQVGGETCIFPDLGTGWDYCVKSIGTKLFSKIAKIFVHRS